jgi:hypothetical protein
MKGIGWLFLGIVPAYVVACAGTSASRSHAFNAIQLGDTRQAVVDVFGVPSVVELRGQPFLRYTSAPCVGCKERLWFENRLSLDTEAWSIELNFEDRVIKKYAWHSP